MNEAVLPELAGVEHRFLDIHTSDGPVRIHLAEAGDGEPLLLLHGWPQHWFCWRRVIEPLAGRFRLLMPDLRGFGWSEAPGRGYSPPIFAADAVALLDRLGIDRAKVVGHDWGGFTAFLLGLGAPDRIERIVALNTPHPWIPLSLPVATASWRTWYVVANSFGGGRALADPERLRRLLGLRGRAHIWTVGEAHTYAERFADPARIRVTTSLYRWYLRAAAQVFARGVYRDRRLRVPTRLVFGADDFFIPAVWLDGGERHGDDFAIELVPGCGHFIAEERPDLVAQRILTFLG